MNPIKKLTAGHVLLLFLIHAALLSFGQTRTTTKHGNWSTAGNWQNGVPSLNSGDVNLKHRMVFDAASQTAEVVPVRQGVTFGSGNFFLKLGTGIYTFGETTTLAKPTVTSTVTNNLKLSALTNDNSSDNNSNVFSFNASQSLSAKELFKFQFTSAIQLFQIRLIVSSTLASAGSMVILQGSENNTTWTTLTGSVDVGVTASANTNIDFTVNQNWGYYTYYRLLGESGSTASNNKVQEISIDRTLYTPITPGEINFQAGSSQVAFQSGNQIDFSQATGQGIISGSLFQPVPDNELSEIVKTSSKQTTFSLGYFNRVVGEALTVPSTVSSSPTITLAKNSTFNLFTPPLSTYSVPYSTSIFLDPSNDGKEYSLLVYNSGNNRSSTSHYLQLENGITNFEGGAVVSNGTLYVKNKSTLILGPLACRVCDINDPVYYDQAACTALGSTCTQNRFIVTQNSDVRIQPGARVIVYGNVINDLKAGGGNLFQVDGGLYIVGNYSTYDNSSITGSGDLYTTGSISSQSSASNFFGISIPANTPLCTSDCQATQDLCGTFSLLLSPSGLLPYCDASTIIQAYFTTSTVSAQTVSQSDIVWQEYSGTSWTNVTGTTTTRTNINPFNPPANGSTALISTLALNQAPSSAITYRLQVKTSLCTAGEYSNTITIVPSLAGSGIKLWKGMNATTPSSWNVVSNWCQTGGTNSVPGENDIIVIDEIVEGNGSTAPKYPIISTADAKAKGILIKTNASLTNNGTLTLYGDMENYGLFTNGTTAKTIFSLPQGGTSATYAYKIGGTTNTNSKFNTIEVNQGVELNFPDENLGPAASVNIAGDLTVAGQFKPLTGERTSIRLNSPTNSNITNSSGLIDLYDVSIENPGTSSVVNISGGDVNVYGRISLAGNQLTVKVQNGANGRIVLKSTSDDPDLNGSIGPLNVTTIYNTSSTSFPASDQILSDVVVERFVPSTFGQNWRYFSSAVKPLNSSIVLSGSRYFWLPAPDDNSKGAWRSASSQMKSGSGYLVNFNSITSPVWTATGRINQGQIKLLCGDANCLERSTRGWHLLGNPYPHPIFWSSYWATPIGGNEPIFTTACPGCNAVDQTIPGGFAGCFNCTLGSQNLTSIGTGISRLIAVRDPDTQKLRYGILGNNFTSTQHERFWFFKSSALTSSTDVSSSFIYRFNSIIDIGQAFWVYSYGENFDPTIVPGSIFRADNSLVSLSATNYSAELRITENAKILPANQNATFFNRESEDPDANQRLAIHIKNDKYEDYTFYSFKRPRGQGVGMAPPLPKIWSPGVNVFISNSAKEALIFDDSDGIADNSAVNIGYMVDQSGDYELTFNVTEDFLDGEPLYLVDAYEETFTQIKRGGNYPFFTSAAEKEINDRFYLTKNPQALLDRPALEVFPNPTRDKITIRQGGFPEKAISSIYDGEGKLIDEREFIKEFTLDLSNWAFGMYFVKIKSSKGLKVEKFIKTR